MKNKIYTVFDQIHAEDALKQKTEESVFEYIHQHKRQSVFPRKRLFVFSAVLLCMCIGFTSHQFFFKEAFALSVDVNPSIELGINRLDKVISVQGYNTEGEEIISAVNIKYANYDEAIDCIVEEERRCGYLVDNDEVSITVDCPKEEKFQEINDRISTCKIQEKQTVSIDQCQNDTVEEAHKNGMSFGKYKATLQLQEVNPCVTIEDAKDMSMKDIKAMTNGETSLHGNAPQASNMPQQDETLNAATSADSMSSTSQMEENKAQNGCTSSNCLCKDNCTCSSSCTNKDTTNETTLNSSSASQENTTPPADSKDSTDTSVKTDSGSTNTSTDSPVDSTTDKPADQPADTSNTSEDSAASSSGTSSTISNILDSSVLSDNTNKKPAPLSAPLRQPILLEPSEIKKELVIKKDKIIKTIDANDKANIKNDSVIKEKIQLKQDIKQETESQIKPVLEPGQS